MSQVPMSPILQSCCAVLLAALACLPASARTLVDISLVDRDDGTVLPQYHHRGERWLAGVPGHRYAIRLANTSGERVLVVLSVDGVNAVTGEDADPSQGGYVLEPWQSAEIGGWRKSLQEVAQFRFTDLADSYAARTGRPGNVGVIGIAVFRERRPAEVLVSPDFPPPYPRAASPQSPYEARDEAGVAESGAANDVLPSRAPPTASAARQQIGTGHGAREWAPASRTGFVRDGARPSQLSELRYDAPRRLLALGILPRRDWQHRPVVQVPRAFPRGFVPDP
ncbi:hypothetical protein [Luteimonas mephitis]|uniref:hypothetical protein n=1 Tax=Luteimonas mephitis TaxID=83615 RepID=UPI00041B75B5|nr:hypothetical protein [Luteimonas mephitis]